MLWRRNTLIWREKVIPLSHLSKQIDYTKTKRFFGTLVWTKYLPALYWAVALPAASVSPRVGCGWLGAPTSPGLPKRPPLISISVGYGRLWSPLNFKKSVMTQNPLWHKTKYLCVGNSTDLEPSLEELLRHCWHWFYERIWLVLQMKPCYCLLGESILVFSLLDK